MVDHSRADDRGKCARRVGLPGERRAERSVGSDRAERLEHVVVDYERERDVSRKNAPDAGHEILSDVLEIERACECGG